MNTYVEMLAQKYRHSGCILDANVLLAYVVGRAAPGILARFKKTSAYTDEDIDVLTNVVRYFRGAVALPHIWTEVSNLAGQLPEGSRALVRRQLAEDIKVIGERYLSSSIASLHRCFVDVGLTDAVIVSVAAQGILVVTDDAELYHTLLAHRLDAININHLRGERWFGSLES